MTAIDRDPALDEFDDFPLTESLAALYREQGHLGRALAVYDELVARGSADAGVLARRRDLEQVLHATRPRPFDAAESGGTPVREWLAHLADPLPPAPRPATGLDAFYATPLPTSDQNADMAAFQSWLKGLGK